MEIINRYRVTMESEEDYQYPQMTQFNDGEYVKYSDHKAVAETLETDIIASAVTIEKMQEKIDSLEISLDVKNSGSHTLSLLVKVDELNADKLKMQNKIDELEKENKSLKGANETMNIVINNMEDLGV